MSQYPPPSSFRGPFNPKPQLTPSSSATHHAIPQFPYHSFRDPNNQNLSSAQFAHSYTYNNTSHGVNSSLSVPGAHQAPYVGFGQTSNGPFLPPPYPPALPSYGVLPQPPSSLVHHHEPSLGSIQPHNSLPSKPPPVAAMTGDPNFEKSQTVTANISELEDGELSDGELGESSSAVAKTARHSTKRDSGSPSKSIKNGGDSEKNVNRISKANHEKGESNSAYSLKNVATQIQNQSSSQEIAQTVPPRSHMDNSTSDEMGQSHRNSGDTPPSSHSMMRNLAATSGSMPQNTLSTREEVYPTDFSRNESAPDDVGFHRKWQDLHDRAKDALKQLYDDGIGFAEIANEGIDPAILQNLYSELGISIPLGTNQNGVHRTADGSNGSVLETIEPLRDVVKNILQREDENNATENPKKLTQASQNLGTSKDAPNFSSSNSIPNQRSSSLTESISKRGNKLAEGKTITSDSHTPNVQSSNLVSKPTPVAKAPTLVTNNLLGKPTTSKNDKALERKDYIARMLAAKSGKPISAANRAVSPSPPINRLKETVPKVPLVGENQTDGVQERCVQVENIPRNTTEEDFKNLFSGYEIQSVSIEKALPSNKVTGAGFVVLGSATEAQRAISELSGKHIQERRVTLQLARKTDGTAQAIEVAVQEEAKSTAEVFSGSVSKSEMDVEANKRAQTELARQKIEALKNRVNILPPAVTYRSNVQGASSGQEQQNLMEESQSKFLQQESSATSKPMAISQTQSSFPMSTTRNSAFGKPAFGKPAFVIPGLFMDSMPSEPLTVSEQSKVQPHTEEPQDKPEAKLVGEVGSSESESAVELSQIFAAVNPQATSVQSTDPEAQKRPFAMVGMTNEPRKRQKAADFIDSPSTRVRRPLGQNEETSVIIEISEDETNGGSEDEKMDIDDDIAMDIDEDNSQHSPPKPLLSLESASGKPKGIRDLPPLSDFSGKKKISSQAAVVTPPAPQTPSKGREPESLRIKEKKIELMNRRIAELEQRLKAKQTASRAHTPGTPGSTAASPKLSGISLGSHEKPRSGVGDKEANHILKDKSEDRILSETMEMEEAAKLDATKAPGVAETSELTVTTKPEAAIETTDLVEATEVAEAAILAGLAKAVETAESADAAKAAESAEAVDAAKAADAARAADAAEAAEAAKVAEAAKTAEAVKVAEAAEAARAAETAKLIEQEKLLAEQQAKTLQLAKADAERLRATEVAAAQEEKQRQVRRAEIESGLPILDAEVERTKQKLELLQKEVDILSKEVQKGIDGRRALLEELNGLTPPDKSSRISQEQTHINGTGTHSPKPMVERHKLSSIGHRVDLAERHQNVRGRLIGNEDNLHSPPLPVSAGHTPKNLNEQTTTNEDPDDMDTSPDGLNDAEITDYSPEPPTNVPARPGSIDAEDVYEPPVTVDTISIPPVYSQNEEFGHDINIAETAMLQPAPSAPPSDVDGRRRSPGSEVISNSFDDVHAQYEPQAPIRSTKFADASDSDDYEPPEPSPPVEHTLLSPDNAASDISSFRHDSAVGSGPDSHSLPADSITVMKEQMKTDEIGTIDTNSKYVHDGDSNVRVTKFTPYESPLKQFKSYRYHPDYLSEVRCGFRSLTYSHGIDPQKLVCQFEVAGGVCNDNSCDGQHFRNMSLSDDMVLVQMGAIPEGLTSQERDAYANGLRRIIQEIRGRKVRDFNAVASEITAYRAKFLGDNLKLLPL